MEFQLAMTYEPLGESKRAVQSVLSSGLSGAAGLYGQLAEQVRQWTARPLELSQLLSRLIVPEVNPYAAHTRGQEALWPFGISGDDPILAAVVQETELEWCVQLALQHSVTARLGFDYDLVYLLPSVGEHSMEETLKGNLAHLHLTEELGAGAASTWYSRSSQGQMRFSPMQPLFYRVPASGNSRHVRNGNPYSPISCLRQPILQSGTGRKLPFVSSPMAVCCQCAGVISWPTNSLAGWRTRREPDTCGI